MEGNNSKLSVEAIRQNCNIDWRDTRPGILDRMNFLCMKDEMADIYFIFKHQGNEQMRIPAHKFVLSLASEVFYKEFSYEIASDAEKRSKQVLEIEVNDAYVEINALKQMLHFIYSGFKNVRLTDDSVFDVLYIAQKYLIKQLETRCINFLVENIDVANVFTIVQYCLDVEVDKKVMENCKDFLQCEIGEMVKTDEFNHISIKCLKFLLELNHINLPEIDLFKAILRWANFNCELSKLPKTPENVRNMLGQELFGLIRFPTMSTKDFADVVVPMNILTTQECLDIVLTQTLEDYQPKNPLPYSKISRSSLTIGGAVKNSGAAASNGASVATTTAASLFNSIGSCSSTLAPFKFPTTAATITSKPNLFGNITSSNMLGGAFLHSGPNGATKNDGVSEENGETEEPPKPVEVNQAEKDAIFSTKCTVYTLNDGRYVSKGVSYVSVKSVAGGKRQLIIRAATTLGSIWANVLINSDMRWSKLRDTDLQLSFPLNSGTKTNGDSDWTSTGTAKPVSDTLLIRVAKAEELESLIKHF